MRKNLVIFDIDGVLLDSDHRLDYMVRDDWEIYFSLAPYDTPIPQGILLCQMFLESNFSVLFVTGRGDTPQHRKDTVSKLEEYLLYNIPKEQLLMREWPKPTNYLEDPIKKPLMIQEAGYSLDQIFLVFEDRKCIVDMWRDRGVICYQTKAGDF